MNVWVILEMISVVGVWIRKKRKPYRIFYLTWHVKFLISGMIKERPIDRSSEICEKVGFFDKGMKILPNMMNFFN